MILRVAPGVGSFWEGFSTFFDPEVKTTDWIKANLWNWNTQPNYTPAKPPGPVVPSPGYENEYRWCSPTDVACLNRITNQPNLNVVDAQRNMANYSAAQLAAIKQAEDEAAAKDKENLMMWVAVVALGGGAFYVLSQRSGRR